MAKTLDRDEIMSKLTDEQKATIEKLEAVLTDEKNREFIMNTTDIEEIMAFYERNGFTYTEEQKEDVRKRYAEACAVADGDELTEEQLQAIAGGWSWNGFWGGLAGGAIVGGLIGAIALGPAGWIIAGAGIGIVVGGGTLGGILGLVGD